MDGVLLTFTILSAAATFVLGAYAWKSARRERERSRARVAALSTAIDGGDGRPGAGASPGTALFSDKRSIPFEGHSRITAGAGLVMLTCVALGFAFTWNGSTSSEQTVPTSIAARRAAEPIELLSMRHNQDRDALTVAGLVRNPREGVQVRHVTAIVFGFDRQDNLVASGRGALDFVTLQPGDESTFVVALPRPSHIARYRVTFQTDDGVLRHVDRRAELPIRVATDKVQS